MINAWFTADFHLGHRNILRYCNRPFQSTGEMDEAILGNLNSRVGQSDVLYFLGDFCMGGPDQAGVTGIELAAAISMSSKGITTARFAASRPRSVAGLNWPRFESRAKGLCSVTTLCGSGIIRREARGTCMAIRTASSKMPRHRYPWMLEWMLTSFYPGTSTR
jgi:hypothetical protein